MSKDRLSAFIDAVLAIIMTILVLNLDLPPEPTLAGLLAMRVAYFTYALTFFWLGSLWMSLNSLWAMAKTINNRIVFLSLVLLFFCSLMPYASSLASANIDNRVMQGFYGVVIILITIMNWFVHLELERQNPQEPLLTKSVQRYRHNLIYDLLVKFAGLAIALLWYPQAMMASVVISAILINILKNREFHRLKRCVQQQEVREDDDDE